MAEIFLNVVVNQDRRKRFQLEDFVDSVGNITVTDGGVQGQVNESGAAELVVDTAADPSGYQIVVKSDNTATEFPATSVIRSFIDTRLGDDVNKLELVITVTTLPAEAVSFNAREIGDEPRD
ncbi:MAG TPA: hypothetical protein PLR96_09880 [Flavobacteriales bacterium]|jgi:hypothetical protein|nr:hypothetical protein [Flavobacteriales bacterium]